MKVFKKAMTNGHRSGADSEVNKEKGLALLLAEAEATLCSLKPH